MHYVDFVISRSLPSVLSKKATAVPSTKAWAVPYVLSHFSENDIDGMSMLSMVRENMWKK